MSIINEKNEIFNSAKEYKSEGKSISHQKVEELFESGEFWAYNGYDVKKIDPANRFVITKEGNCIRRLTRGGYVTIGLKTLKK